jgi:membrane-bound serine protease (ClpP class)
MDGYLLLALALVAAGVLLLAAEFVLPTGGLLLLAGIVAWGGAVLVVLANGSQTEAAVAVLALAVGLPAAGAVVGWGYRKFARRVGPTPLSATAFDTPEQAELATLKGRFGTTVTPMRPSGAVQIDGKRVDAQTEGLMLDAGTPVKCVDVRAGRVIVRRADAAPDLTRLTFDDPA